VVEAGGDGASAKRVDGGAVSAFSIGSARFLIGVCLPRLRPRCARRAQEWGGVQTCFFALWGPSLTCCDVFAVYSFLCCRLSVCFLSCASPAYGGRLVYFCRFPNWAGGARRGGRDGREGQGGRAVRWEYQAHTAASHQVSPPGGVRAQCKAYASLQRSLSERYNVAPPLLHTIELPRAMRSHFAARPRIAERGHHVTPG